MKVDEAVGELAMLWTAHRRLGPLLDRDLENLESTDIRLKLIYDHQ
jgi:hypothetical protein